MEVEFSLMVSKDFQRGLNTLRAKNVTLAHPARLSVKWVRVWGLGFRVHHEGFAHRGAPACVDCACTSIIESCLRGLA